jgi:hypothetical protein
MWRLLKNLNTDLPYDPTIPLLGIRKECNSNYYKNTCTPCLLQHYSQQPCYGNSQDAPLPTMEFYSATKKNEILSFASKWIELENIILSKVSQAQKAKNCMFSLICR